MPGDLIADELSDRVMTWPTAMNIYRWGPAGERWIPAVCVYNPLLVFTEVGNFGNPWCSPK